MYYMFKYMLALFTISIYILIVIGSRQVIARYQVLCKQIFNDDFRQICNYDAIFVLIRHFCDLVDFYDGSLSLVCLLTIEIMQPFIDGSISIMG